MLIQKCNKVILCLDNLEEYRPFLHTEFNFCKLVQLHLDELLLAECNYWRKRCTARWIKQGEDNTKKIHAMASERYRRNSIAMLLDDSGNEVTDHQAMAGLLWSNFKERMGNSEGISMQFDLDSLLSKVEGLDVLTVPFDKKEMDEVIKKMSTDRSPGPDGFNGLFVKKCWPIIQEDFYRLASDFHKGTLKMENINSSYITLIPKKSGPLGANDFRPISLTNVCLKFLTKMVADRLQNKILECLHKNQYGFLRTRSIQDCLA
jgi:hypothetical protein